MSPGQGEVGSRFFYLFLLAAIAIIVVPLAVAGILTHDDGAVSSTPSTLAQIELGEFSIEGDLTVPAGEVTLAVSNAGSAEHNLVVADLGKRTPNLQSRASASLDLGNLAPGEYEFFCDIPGHREAGMVATFEVISGATTGDTAGHDLGSEQDWETLDQAMIDSIMAFPAATEGRGNLPLEPTILPDGTKQFELTASIEKWETEPGLFVDAWTYNGQVPGPMIRVDLGDKVEVIVHNELPMGTDVHWHGVHTPNDQDGVAPLTQDLIYSGETFTYEFEAVDPAVGMYHAHHHGQLQIPNGLFGVFMIGGV